MANDFKYIINTELKLNSGSVKALIEEVKAVDGELKQALSGNKAPKVTVQTKLQLERNAAQSLQEQIGTVTAKVNLELDRTSLDRIVRQVRDAMSAVTANVNVQTRETTANSTPRSSGGNSDGGMRRINERGNGTRRGNAPSDSYDRDERNYLNTIARQRMKDANDRVRLKTYTDNQAAAQARRDAARQASEDKRFYDALATQRAKEANDRVKAANTLAIRNTKEEKQYLDQLAKERQQAANKRIQEQEHFERQQSRTPMGASQQLPKSHPVRQGIEEDNRLRRIVDLQRNQQDKLGQWKLSNEWNQAKRFRQQQLNTRTGAVSVLPAGHPIRRAVEQDRAAQKEYSDWYNKAMREQDRVMSTSPTSRFALNHVPTHMDDSYVKQIRDRQRQEQEVAQAWSVAETSRKQEERRQINFQNRQGNTPTGAVSRLPQNHPVRILDRQAKGQQDMQAKLLDPNVPMEQKNALLKQYDKVFSDIAKSAGTSFTKSFKIRSMNDDGTISELRTLTKEYTANGKVVDRSSTSMTRMFSNITKHMFGFEMLQGAVRGVTQALEEGMTYLEDYQEQYIRLANIMETRNQDITNGVDVNGVSGKAQIIDPKAVDNTAIQLSKKYGLNAEEDILPLYSNILKRKDLAPDKATADKISESIIQAAFVAHGTADVRGEDINKIQEDAVTVYSKMQRFWGKNAPQNFQNYNDYLAALSLRGGDIAKTYDSVAELSEYADPSKLSLNRLSSLVARYSVYQNDMNGSEIGTTIKMMFANILNPNSQQSALAREAIGIDLMNSKTGQPTTLQEALDQMGKKYNSLGSEDSKDTFATLLARNLSSASGSGGGRQLDKFKTLIRANAESMDDEQQLGDTSGTAKQVSSQYVSAFKGSINQLVSSLEALMKNLGDAGLLNILGALAKGLTGLINIANALLEKWNALGNATQNLIGVNLTSIVTSFFGLAGALKVLKFALNSLGYGELLTTAGVGIAGKIMGSATPLNKGAYIGKAVGGGLATLVGVKAADKFAVREVSAKIGGKIGAIPTKIATTGRTLGRGFASGMAVQEDESIISRLLGGFAGLGSTAWTLMGVLGKLTVVTSVLSIGIEAIISQQKQIEDMTKSHINNMQRNFSTTQSSQDFKKEFSRFVELDKKVFSNDPKNQATEAERKEFGSLTDDLKKKGLYVQGPHMYGYDFGSGQKGDLNTHNQKSIDKFLGYGNTLTTKNNSYITDYVRNAGNLENYFAILDQMQKMGDITNAVQEYTQLGGSQNDYKFQGATDSASYFLAQMGVSSNALDNLSSQYGNLISYRQTIDDNRVQALSNYNDASGKIDPKVKQQMDARYDQMKQAGQEGQFMNEYADVSTDEGRKQNQYAIAKYNYELGLEQEKQIQQQIQQTTQAVTEQITKLKDMYVQYVQASAGVQVYDQALKGIQTDITSAQNLMNAINNPDQKASAAANVFGQIGRQVNTLSAELNSVDGKMQQVWAANSSQDFSISALYNPDSAGLSPEQAAYKGLLEKRQEINDSLQQAVASQREMQEQMVQLIMSTDKYRTMWDSVQSRIQMIRDMAKQIRDLQNQETVNAQMETVRKSVMGTMNYDSAGDQRQQYQNLRDQHLGNVAKLQQAQIEYGQDSGKLKEAIQAINTSTQDQMKTAVIDPLKNMIDNNMGEVVRKQQDASDQLNKGAQFFQQSADQLLQKIQNLKLQISSDGKSASFSDGSAPTNDPYSTKGTYWDNKDMNDIHNQMAYRRQLQKEQNGNEPTSFSGQQDFVQKMSPYALQVSQQTSLPVDYILTQWGLESGWGTSEAANENHNFAGIKPWGNYGAGQDSMYAGYSSVSDFADGYAQFYLQNSNYSKLLAAAKGGASTGQLFGILGSTGYAEDPNYTQSLSDTAGVVRGYIPNNIPSTSKGNGSVALTNNTSSLTGLDNSAQEAAKEDAKYQRQAQLYAMQELFAAFKDEAQSTINNSVQYNVNSGIRDAKTKYAISGQYIDQVEGTYDSYNQGRMNIVTQLQDNSDEIARLKNERAYRQSQSANYYADAVKTGDYSLYNENKSGIQMFTDQINALQKNTDALTKMQTEYEKQAYFDPRHNGGTAQKQMDETLQSLRDMIAKGQDGDVQFYKVLEGLQRDFQDYFTKQKAVDDRQFAFDNFGFDYQGLANAKIAKWHQDMQILASQASQVMDVLGKLKAGSNDWFTVLQDAVAIQQKYIQLENQKAQLSQQWFEMTGKDIYPYINSRAYVQSRDYVQNGKNLQTAKNYYSSNSQKMDGTEQLTNLQIISEMGDKLEQQMNDYRDAVVGAFKAGAISIDEYIQRLYDLRDLQRESKEQAIDMMNSFQSTFQSSLSDALQKGMQGSFDAPQQFMQSIKNGLSQTISGQMSTLILNNSGLKSVMDNLSKSMSSVLSNPDPNVALNAFNDNNFGQQLNDAISPFMPLIQQISASTDGIFGILKDQVYNAPSGFKVDDYLYSAAKDKTYAEVAPWLNNISTNEAGSPMGYINKDRINLPTLPPPKGVPNVVTKPIDPIRGNGGTTSSSFNPVTELLNNIMSDQGVYSPNLSSKDATNVLSHTNANDSRALLGAIAPDVLKAIGDGDPAHGGMNQQQIADYLKNTDLSQYQVVESTDGVNTTITGMNSDLKKKLDAVNASTQQVVSAIKGKQEGNATAKAAGVKNAGTPSNPNAGMTDAQKIALMKANSSEWGSADATGKQALNDANLSLGASMGWHKDPQSGVWYDQTGKRAYHTGGIAGMGNFASAKKLLPSEVDSLLQRQEFVFQPPQLSDLIGGAVARYADYGSGSMAGSQSTSSNNGMAIHVTVNGGGDKSSIAEAVEIAVKRSISEIQRQTRLTNLQTRGVSF